MSEETVALVRDGFEQFARTGEIQLDTLHPDFEVHDHDIPDAGSYRGADGFAQWLQDWGEAWGDYDMEAERWIDAGDKVVLLLHMTARGQGSGVQVDRRDGMVWTISEGKTIRIDYYGSQPEALRAAGVEG